METLKKQLNDECSYRMKDETMERFLGLMTERQELKGGETLIPYGKFDDNVYVLKSGIVRFVYFDGAKETTFGFSSPGTVMISYYPFYRREPSFFQLEACCESVVMKIPKAKFTKLIEESNDFAQWVLWLWAAQSCLNEKKLAVVNGDAKERFESLVKNRPEIIEKVPKKIIASYIGITPEYLSRLKKRFMPDS
jgi:CRP-like cAMP-binding protein